MLRPDVHAGDKMRTSRVDIRAKAADVRGAPTPSPPAVDVAALVQLFDQVPDSTFFVKDSHGRYLAVNASLVERHGLKQKSQAIGKRPCDICPGEFGRIPSQQDADVLRLGRPLLDHLEMHWYAPHQPGWCLTTKLPLRDAAGNIVGLIGISRDVRAPIKPQEIPGEVAAALNAFEKRLDEPTTPSSLAVSAGLTPARFARLLRRFFGLTPSQYIAKARIAAASTLLGETERTVADIGLACGFADHSSFTRAFRKVAGVSPTQFRESQRKC